MLTGVIFVNTRQNNLCYNDVLGIIENQHSSAEWPTLEVRVFTNKFWIIYESVHEKLFRQATSFFLTTIATETKQMIYIDCSFKERVHY